MQEQHYLTIYLQKAKVIRIEDTDLKRNVAGGEESQLQYLRWLGIDWDESIDKDGGYGPYRQTERLDIYRKYYLDLLDRGLAYHCFCSEEELEAHREEQMAKGLMPTYSGKCCNLSEEEKHKFASEGRIPSIRFKVPKEKVYTFNDLVKGEVSFESNGIGDWVIVKKDGIPTYNFAVAVDDHEMAISHVLRGDDHITNTPKQLMIYEALNWQAPTFGHMTLIVNEQHKKLSKRDETIIQFIEQYDQLGYLPEALFNFIALLGWSPEGEEEIFSHDQFVSIFNADRLSKSPAVFNAQKLTWLNNQYMKELDGDKLVDIALPHLIKAGRLPNDLSEEQKQWAKELIVLHQEKMHYGAEIVPLTEMFFQTSIEYGDEAKEVLSGEQVPEVLRAFLENVKALETFTAQDIKGAIKAVQKSTGHKGKNLFMPVRVATTGDVHGPDLPQAIQLLGKEVVISRLESLL
jgi:nondiscriminating glutamyl-tRNA synthetase